MPRGKAPTRRKPRPEREVNAAREHHTPTGKSFCTSKIWVVGSFDCVLRSPPPESRFLAPEKSARNDGRNKPRPKYAIPQFVRLRRRAGGWPVLQTVTELSNGGASGAIIANYLAQSV